MRPPAAAGDLAKVATDESWSRHEGKVKNTGNHSTPQRFVNVYKDVPPFYFWELGFTKRSSDPARALLCTSEVVSPLTEKGLISVPWPSMAVRTFDL